MLFKIDLHKKFTSKRRSISIALSTEISVNKITAIYGKSGIGKTSILRMIAGLELPDSGEVIFNGKTWYSKNSKTFHDVAKRKIGFVFQEYNLFPNMTVLQNMKYASINHQIPTLVEKMCATLEIDKLLDVYPAELSGGQKQRIAIVRALCQEPDLLILDEPFSALDDDAIADLIEEIRKIHVVQSFTILLVSHRKDIIFRLADEVIHLLDNGQFKQGSPEEILSRTL